MHQKKEHILVCLSSSPSSVKIIQAAARLAKAFGGTFTALYVQTPDAQSISAADREQLQQNLHLAGHLGATIVSVSGEDIPYQIAEYSRLSKVTKVVVGRSRVPHRHLWRKPTLTERLTAAAPDLDICIIPDSSESSRSGPRKELFSGAIVPSVKSLLITLTVLAVTTAIGHLFDVLHFTQSNIITVYILGVLLNALFTKSYTCSVISSLASVFLVNYLFTEPRLTLHAYEPSYPVTFAIMLFASLLTGTLANKLQAHAKQSAQASFRTKVLFDTNQLLQKAKDDNDALSITAQQLMTLLNCEVIAYPESEGHLTKELLFSPPEKASGTLATDEERKVAQWVFENQRCAGATTEINKRAKGLYYAIRINHTVFGVVGIFIGDRTLDPFESSVLLSILGECALAIENSRNIQERERTELLAKNEQLRANLLRTISHDLRTPLTSISGNAENLLCNGEVLDAAAKAQIVTDIYEDSQWLIDLVENLLSITRLDEGQLQLHLSAYLVDEVISEALVHIRKPANTHPISVQMDQELLLADMDPKLIVQVLVNLINNAIKYTLPDTEIQIRAWQAEQTVFLSVADSGGGIPDRLKDEVFQMFFTGENHLADSHRSLGLGLPLCKAIVAAHGGELLLTDNSPHGCLFTFSLKASEVCINE